MKDLPAQSPFAKGGFLDQGKNRRREKIIKKTKQYNARGNNCLCDLPRSDFSESPFAYSSKSLYSSESQNTVLLQEKYSVCPIHSGTPYVLIYLLCAGIFTESDGRQLDDEKKKVNLRS